MPYDPNLAADEEKIRKHLRTYWSGKAPDVVVRQYAEVFNSIYDESGDEGRAHAGARAVAKRRVLQAASVTPGAALLARCATPAVLGELQQAASRCGCGQPHETLVSALRLARSAVPAADESFEQVDVDVDIAFAWKAIATDIYRNADKVVLDVREMWQNSRDAGAKNIQIDWSASDDIGTLIFTDDGGGMTPEIFKKVFMKLGASKKAAGAVGGFGAAKAAILAAGEKWDWEISSQDWIARSTDAGSSQLQRGQTWRPGVQIKLSSIDPRVRWSTLGNGRPLDRIKQFVAACDLRGIVAMINGEPVEGSFTGRRGKTEEAFEKAGWGSGIKVQVRSYVRDDPSGSIYVRLSGILQFAYERPHGVEFKRDYLIDMDITDLGLTPGTPNYPFRTGRDEFADGTPAMSAYRKMRDALTEKGSKSAEKEMGEYETIAPDSSDPRERAAQEKFDDTIGEVMGSPEFANLFSDLGTVSREFHEGAYGNIPKGVRIEIREGDESPLPGGNRYDDPRNVEQSDPRRPPANPYATLEAIQAADDNELVEAVRGWLFIMLGGVSDDVSWALDRFQDQRAWAEDFEMVMREVKRGAEQHGTNLATAAAVHTLGERLQKRLREEEVVEAKRKWSELNPFGGSAIIKISRERYGSERGKKFRRSGAKKYMKHLALWDFTVRQVIAASAGIPGIGIGKVKLQGLGFVLDDEALGLCSHETSGIFVMVNPEMLDNVIQTNKDRPWVIANYLHGLACHELAHAAKMQSRGDAGHNEAWSVEREHSSKGTAWLMPAVATAARKLFRGVRKWSGGGGRAAPDAGSAAWRALQAKHQTEIAGLEGEIGRLRDENKQNSEFVGNAINALSVWEKRGKEWAIAGPEWEARDRDQTAAIARLEAMLVEAKTPARWFSERSTPLIHALEQMVQLQEFREWLRVNPKLTYEVGITVEDMLQTLSEPGAMSALLADPMSWHTERAPRTEGARPRSQPVDIDLAPAAELVLDPGHAGHGEPAFHLEDTPGPACPPTKGAVNARGFPKNVGAFAEDVKKRGVRADSKAWELVRNAAQPVVEKHGVRLGDELGCGQFACAYSVIGDDQLVGKFTGDPSEAAVWKRIIDLEAAGEPWPAGLSRVHCVEALPFEVRQTKGTNANRRMFFVLQEKLLPLNKGEAKFFDDKEVGNAIISGQVVKAVEMAETANSTWLPEWFPLQKTKINVMGVRRLAEAAFWLSRQRVEWHDIHSGNIMRNVGGEYKIMDLGYSVVPTTEIGLLAKSRGLSAAQREEVFGAAAARLAKSAMPVVCPPSRGAVTAKGHGGITHRQAIWRNNAVWGQIAEKIKPVLARYELKIGEELGCGKFACAFAVEGRDDLVVKITGDPADAAAWQTLLNAAEAGEPWHEAVAQVYCVESIPMSRFLRSMFADERQMFVILQERLSPIYEGTIGATFLDSRGDDFGPDVRKLFMEKDSAGLFAYATEIGAPKEWIRPLLRAIGWLRSKGVEWFDLHSGNVMLGVDGKPKIVDLGAGNVAPVTVKTLAASRAPKDELTEAQVIALREIAKFKSTDQTVTTVRVLHARGLVLDGFGRTRMTGRLAGRTGAPRDVLSPGVRAEVSPAGRAVLDRLEPQEPAKPTADDVRNAWAVMDVDGDGGTVPEDVLAVMHALIKTAPIAARRLKQFRDWARSHIGGNVYSGS